MTVVNTHDAKTHLSELLRRAEAGEEIVIARGGKPVARLVRLTPAKGSAPRRKLGTMRGAVVFNPGWDEPMADHEVAEWHGGPVFPPARPPATFPQ